MGITGLIPFLEKASSKINIKDLKGCTVAIDSYCWLHKGAYGCAEKLSRGESTNIHILYCLKFVNMLLSFNIKPILVFDGRHLPAKALTESRRRDNRNQAKKKAAELLRLGKLEEARIQMRRCIDITHQMVLELIQECRKLNVDCLVAPYEADAQLAYLNKKEIAQYVITEDSDLTLFGASKVIFKLDLTGNCLLVDKDKLHLAMGCKLEKYTFDKFRNMCILSGCDYLDSLPGIGLAKACKFFLITEETDMRRALKKLPRYLNMKNLVVSEDYIEDFLKAEATFKHMYVFDPFERKMVRLNNIPKDIENYDALCSNAGSLLDLDISFNLALGNLDPFTLKELDSWNPDVSSQITNSWGNAIQSKHPSIWKPNYKPHSLKKKTCINAFSFKKIAYANTDESQNSETEIKDECSVVSLYSENEPPLKKNKCNSYKLFEENSVTSTNDIENKHNPFAKSVIENSARSNSLSEPISTNESTKICKLERLSQFKRTVIDNSKEVKSRFFMSNTSMIQKSAKDNTEEVFNETKNNCSMLEERVVNNLRTDNQINIECLYSPDKCVPVVLNINNDSDNETNIETNEIITLNNSPQNVFKSFECSKKQFQTNDKDANIIEISDSETNSKSEPKKIIPPRIDLSRKKSTEKYKCDNPNSQTRLSMFGFKKRTSIQR